MLIYFAPSIVYSGLVHLKLSEFMHWVLQTKTKEISIANGEKWGQSGQNAHLLTAPNEKTRLQFRSSRGLAKLFLMPRSSK